MSQPLLYGCCVSGFLAFMSPASDARLDDGASHCPKSSPSDPSPGGLFQICTVQRNQTMGEKAWVYDFETEQDRLRVHFTTKRGQVKAIVVIQYETYVDGAWRAIVRFDEAHGFFHQDIMSPTAKQRKIAWPASDKKRALTEAIRDIKQHWRFYRRAYEDEYYETKQSSQSHGPKSGPTG